MKKLISALVCLFAFAAAAQKADPKTSKKAMNLPSIYDRDYKVTDISGESFSLKSLKGKKVMIVNTASECGLTPQYKELESLYKQYKDKDFVIVGFPANNFGSQEPGTNAQIAQFCEKNFGVTFPMMSKISVKGDGMSPVYEFLTKKSENGVEDSEVQWNFQKYLLNEKGELVKVIAPQTSPKDEEIIGWLKN